MRYQKAKMFEGVSGNILNALDTFKDELARIEKEKEKAESSHGDFYEESPVELPATIT